MNTDVPATLTSPTIDAEELLDSLDELDIDLEDDGEPVLLDPQGRPVET